MSSGQASLDLIIVVIVFFFAAFFVAAEFALVGVRKSALESALEAGKGNKKKLELALKMTNNLNEYLSTTQVVLNRCAMTKVIRFFINLLSAFWTIASDSESKLAVASSNIKILGLRKNALAIAILWLLCWPCIFTHVQLTQMVLGMLLLHGATTTSHYSKELKLSSNLS